MIRQNVGQSSRMPLSYAILLWVAVSVVGTPFIAALIFRQFRQDPEYLLSDEAPEPGTRNFGRQSGNAARAAPVTWLAIVSSQLGKPARLPGAQSRKPRRILH